MDEETWKKGEELVEKMPKLKTDNVFEWREEGVRDKFILLCELLKGNAIPTKALNLGGDEKEEMEKKVEIMIMIYK